MDISFESISVVTVLPFLTGEKQTLAMALSSKISYRKIVSNRSVISASLKL